MREALPFGVGGGLVAIKTLLSRDPCVHANTAIEMIDAILKEHPAAPVQPVKPSLWEQYHAAQPAPVHEHEPENEPYVSMASVQEPVQEPVQATMKLESSGPGHGPAPNQKLSVRHVSLIDAGKTPPVQPAVPDAIGPNEDELPAYAAGWNDCRQAMLEMMK
jgi:hypothetical protein